MSENTEVAIPPEVTRVEWAAILAMHQLGATPEGAYLKSIQIIEATLQVLGEMTPDIQAKISEPNSVVEKVPEVLRVYRTIIGLQYGALNEAFVLGKGNFGTRGNHPPASPRITECKLSQRGMELITRYFGPAAP